MAPVRVARYGSLVAVTEHTGQAEIMGELATVTRRHGRAQATVEETAKRRDDLIRAALAAGVRRSQIIALTDLSPARIEQIRRRTR